MYIICQATSILAIVPSKEVAMVLANTCSEHFNDYIEVYYNMGSTFMGAFNKGKMVHDGNKVI